MTCSRRGASLSTGAEVLCHLEKHGVEHESERLRDVAGHQLIDVHFQVLLRVDATLANKQKNNHKQSQQDAQWRKSGKNSISKRASHRESKKTMPRMFLPNTTTHPPGRI